ncbi:cysteine hydrolase family protein [Achromobacter sp. DH1f]|uniref:cysteine hydrolase family protein n=1 Tax=Achromobacter sp. DH1f TaxID=1397275 RepID=UPI00046A3068|nr:isochorismatase family cysteine hydrolase [Achromobacter sp. DH1f]
MPYQIARINPAETVVVVVDMQTDFVAAGAPMLARQAHDFVPQLGEFLARCRQAGIRIIYTAHVHRSDRSDVGLYGQLYPPIEHGAALVDGTPGADIHPSLAPAAGEHVIKKHRYSAFFATDLDLMLRQWGIKTVAITGTTTECCCHATARDAMFHNYQVAFLSDLTGTFDYPDTGHGAMTAEQVHEATLVILGASTAHVMTSDEFTSRIERR